MSHGIRNNLLHRYLKIPATAEKSGRLTREHITRLYQYANIKVLELLDNAVIKMKLKSIQSLDLVQ